MPRLRFKPHRHLQQPAQICEFRCYNKSCGRDKFNVFSDTPMMHTKLRARKVLEAFNEVMLARPSISAKELKQRLDTTYPTAFYLLQRIRAFMESSPNMSATGPVEVDEGLTHGQSTDKNKKGKRPPTIIGGYCVNTGKYFIQVGKE